MRVARLSGVREVPAAGDRSRTAGWGAAFAAAVLIVLLPVLAGPYLEARAYLAYAATSTLAFILLAAVLWRFDAVGERVLRLVGGVPVGVVAAFFALAAALAGLVVLDGVPHVSDEVAYQFQARTLALGRLWLPADPDPDAFAFLHTLVDDGKWYGIMNPGWPALLAIGYLAGAPWLVNPLIGALTLLVLHAFLRRAGYAPLEARLATVLLAVSPFVLFMSGTYMAHPANLFLFVVFGLAYTGLLRSGGSGWAVLAGAALGFNLLVRPVDAAAAAAPFLLHLAWRGLVREPRRILRPLLIVGAVASLGAVGTFAWNQQLTGDGRVMPMTKYFEERAPGERFGLGFGPDMGTTLHGSEWPGYYPADAVRVTSYRIAEVLRDVHGLPVLLLAAVLLALARRDWRRDPRHGLLLASGAGLVAIYVFHFYHGIAYGSRHYYLAVPAFAVTLARPLAGWLRAPDPRTARRARALLAAALLFAPAFAAVRLIPEYGAAYRGASGAVRDAVRAQGITDAIVFVESGGWAWKSAFPLNGYPLEENDVLFARDRGEENRRLVERFPGRAAFRLRVGPGERVAIEPLEAIETAGGAVTGVVPAIPAAAGR